MSFVENIRKDFWTRLPTFFGLPTWQELKLEGWHLDYVLAVVLQLTINRINQIIDLYICQEDTSSTETLNGSLRRDTFTASC